jgi:sensor histidine kinase YesM
MARKKEKEKMQLVKQKTEYEKQLAEIKLKALVAQMNPHFIFNCMNSIQAMISFRPEYAGIHLSYQIIKVSAFCPGKFSKNVHPLDMTSLITLNYT